MRSIWKRSIVASVVGLVLSSGGVALADPLPENILENRIPTGGSNITLRKCVGGANIGVTCNADTDCTPGSCSPSNLVHLTVNLFQGSRAAPHPWTPTVQQMGEIQAHFKEINRTIADLTEGQMVLGTVTLVTGASDAVVQLQAGTCEIGSDLCVQDCGTNGKCNSPLGEANTGGWGNLGKINVGVRCIVDSHCFAHEFIHLVGNARDEYEGAAVCGPLRDKTCAGHCTNAGIGLDGTLCLGDRECQLNTPTGKCRQIMCSPDPGPPTDPNSVVGCLMQHTVGTTTVDSELCTPANHDHLDAFAFLRGDTEQSVSNHKSCWESLAGEWSSAISIPTTLVPGPPTVLDPVFPTPSVLDRFVVLVDRSGSMGDRDPPEFQRRIDVAVTAGTHFVEHLSTASEFGLASFSSSATQDFSLQTINDKSATSPVMIALNGLRSRDGGGTNIGAGLRQARDMLFPSTGSSSIHSHILLITDGMNNEPFPNPQRDLDDALQSLSINGLSVFVTCIGKARFGDQCAHIAERTNGTYIDSVETVNLPDAFLDFVAKAENNGIAQLTMGVPIAGGQDSAPISVMVEPGTQQARFVVSWTQPANDLDLLLFRPDGMQVPVSERLLSTQSEFYRVDMPAAGTWIMRVHGSSVSGSERFSTRVLVEHKEINVEAGLARSTITLPGSFLVSAHPWLGSGIEDCQVHASVEKPNGKTEVVQLRDEGDTDDSEAHDGLYSFQYKNFRAGTNYYTFVVRVRCEQGVAHVHDSAEFSTGALPLQQPQVPTFERAVRFSGFVSNLAVDTNPENLPPEPANVSPVAGICRYVHAECQGPMTSVSLDGTCSSDSEGSPLTYMWSSPTGSFSATNVSQPTAYFPPGRNTVQLEVADAEGAVSSSDFGLVVVSDTTAPVIQSITASQSVLWPPDHKMVPVTLDVQVVEACDPAYSCQITSVTSNEPVEGNGDHTTPDWKVTGPLSLKLRQERAGNLMDRVYTVVVTCSDTSNNESTGTVTITVPHDQGPCP